MSSIFSGSLDITAIIEMAQKRHTAYSRSPKNNKVYANVTIWLNDEPDPKTGNILSIQLNSAKDCEPKDLPLNNGKKVYVGNAKYSKRQSPAPLSDNSGIPSSDNFFGGSTIPTPPASGWQDPTPGTGLPF